MSKSLRKPSVQDPSITSFPLPLACLSGKFVVSKNDLSSTTRLGSLREGGRTPGQAPRNEAPKLFKSNYAWVTMPAPASRLTARPKALALLSQKPRIAKKRCLTEKSPFSTTLTLPLTKSSRIDSSVLRKKTSIDKPPVKSSSSSVLLSVPRLQLTFLDPAASPRPSNLSAKKANDRYLSLVREFKQLSIPSLFTPQSTSSKPLPKKSNLIPPKNLEEQFFNWLEVHRSG